MIPLSHLPQRLFLSLFDCVFDYVVAVSGAQINCGLGVFGSGWSVVRTSATSSQ